MKKKSRLWSGLSLLLVLALLSSNIPVNAKAGQKAGVKYVYDKDNPLKRIGIEAIQLDGVTYYDMEQGSGDMSAVDGNNIDFFKKVLTGEAASDEKNSSYTGPSNQLAQWAEVAERIFQENSYYSAEIHADGDFKKNFGQRWGDAGYTDISRALGSESGASWGEKSSDYTIVSGLQYANKLSDIRNISARQIKDMIDHYALNNEFSDHPDTFFTHTDGDNTMKSLNDSTDQDVWYTMVTCVDEEGATYAYHYNTFVMAFYDFKLVPIAADGLNYITSAEGYTSLEDAVMHEAPGVSYTSTENKNPVVNFYENKSKASNTIGTSLDQTHAVSASNALSSSKSFNYSTTIGAEVSMEASFPEIMKVSTKFSTSMTMGQVIGTTFSEEKTITDSLSNTIQSNVTLPAQSAVSIESESGLADVTLDYKCPVAVTYKVALATMGGEVYSDGWLVCSFVTAGYTQKTFSTSFGTNDIKGGLTARTNLYNRTVSNINTPGYESSYGNTYGYRNKHAGDTDKIYEFNWKNVLNGDVPHGGDQVNYTVNYKEVDSDGKMTGRSLMSYDNQGSPNFTYSSSALSSFDYTYQESKEGDPQPITKTASCSLYTGSVKDENGKAVDNSFSPPGTNSKEITLGDKAEDNVITFYYQVAWPSDSKQSITNSSKQGFKPISFATKENEVTPPENSPMSDEDFQKLVGWLGIHEVLSSTGGTLMYQAMSSFASVGQIVPLYQLNKVRLENRENFGNLVKSENGNNTYYGAYLDAENLLDMTLYPGDKFLPRMLDLQGYNENMAPYYGFNVYYGKWQTVEQNEAGKWVKANSDTSVAELVTDPTSGSQYVEAKSEGTYFIQYFIDENKYTSKDTLDYATNDSVERPIVKIVVKNKPFEGKLSLSGDYTGIVGQPAENLADELNVLITDEKGNKVSREISWEAKESKGIQLTPDGNVTFDKAGEYQVRIMSEGIYSDWLSIYAKNPAKLSKITFTAPDFKSAEVTLTADRTSLSYDLESYLEYFDQYGEVWTGDKPAVSFELDTLHDGGEISGKTLTVTKEGDYKVYAKADGFVISPITISVQDMRTKKFDGTVSLSGEYTGTVDSQPVKLDDVLDVFIADSYGRKIEKDHIWDSKETRGIDLKANGEVTFSKAGSYHVRIMTEGVCSEWVTIYAKEGAKLTKITFTAPEFKKSQITLTDSKKSFDFDLSTYLKYYDQYDNVWTGDKPEVTFSLDEEKKGAKIDGNILTVTKEDDYKVYAEAEGFNIEPITISVIDGRKVKSITISGDYQAIVGNPKESIEKFLTVTIKDLSGKEIEQEYTWELQELKGMTISEAGAVVAKTAGTYHVRVQNPAGQYSAWKTITAVKPKITLNKTAEAIPWGSTLKLTATITPSRTSDKTVTWKSSNTAIATVSQTGVVKSIKKGTVTITATDARGAKASCKVDIITPVTIVSAAKEGTAIRVNWTKVAGADGYDIFGARCGKTYKLQKTVDASLNTIKLTKLVDMKFASGCNKFYVKPFKMINGQKTYLCSSLDAHVSTIKSVNYNEAVSVTVEAPSAITVGKTITLDAKVKTEKGKRQINHVAAIRYVSSNPKVASVNSTGMVTGKSSGTCTIYVLAVNGKYTSHKLTVR